LDRKLSRDFKAANQNAESDSFDCALA